MFGAPDPSSDEFVVRGRLSQSLPGNSCEITFWPFSEICMYKLVPSVSSVSLSAVPASLKDKVTSSRSVERLAYPEPVTGMDSPLAVIDPLIVSAAVWAASVVRAPSST